MVRTQKRHRKVKHWHRPVKHRSGAHCTGVKHRQCMTEAVLVAWVGAHLKTGEMFPANRRSITSTQVNFSLTAKHFLSLPYQIKLVGIKQSLVFFGQTGLATCFVSSSFYHKWCCCFKTFSFCWARWRKQSGHKWLNACPNVLVSSFIYLTRFPILQKMVLFKWLPLLRQCLIVVVFAASKEIFFNQIRSQPHLVVTATWKWEQWK